MASKPLSSEEALKKLEKLHVSVPLDKPVKTTITRLKGLRGIAVTNDGLIVISDGDAHCIIILNGNGKRIRSFGSKGTGRGQLTRPQRCGYYIKRKYTGCRYG